MSSPRDSASSPSALTGVFKAAMGSVRDKIRQNRERERALSTMTQLPDDVAWRQDEIIPSDDDSDADSTLSADNSRDNRGQMKRHSADAVDTKSHKEVLP